MKRIEITETGNGGEIPRHVFAGYDTPAGFQLISADDFAEAVRSNIAQPYFENETDFKIFQLETELQRCLANLENHEKRLTLLEGKNVNGNH